MTRYRPTARFRSPVREYLEIPYFLPPFSYVFSYMYFYNTTGTFFSFSISIRSLVLIFLLTYPETVRDRPKLSGVAPEPVRRSVLNNSNEITLFLPNPFPLLSNCTLSSFSTANNFNHEFRPPCPELPRPLGPRLMGSVRV